MRSRQGPGPRCPYYRSAPNRRTIDGNANLAAVEDLITNQVHDSYDVDFTLTLRGEQVLFNTHSARIAWVFAWVAFALGSGHAKFTAAELAVVIG